MSRSSLFLIIFCILIAAGIGWIFFGRETPITNLDSSGIDIIAFGDSLIEGVGATEGMTLPDQLGKKIGTPVINEGIAGETTRDGLARIGATLDQYHPRLIIISLGGNDFLKKLPREETKENLAHIIEAIQSRGSMVMILGVRSGIIGGGFDNEFQSLSKHYGTLYVEDILSGIFGNMDSMSDAVHPNDRGYGIIAERIAKTLNEHHILASRPIGS